MNARRFLILLSLLLAISLLALPALAAEGDGLTGNTAGAEEPAADGGSGQADSTTSGGAEENGAETEGEQPGGDTTEEDGSSSADQNGEEEEAPEPTLEELRDELMAIMGSGEEAETIRAGIDRLIALGDPNGTLRTYLESSIRLHQLQYEMAQLEDTLAQMEASDGTLGTIGEAVSALENPDEVLKRIETEISDQAARLLESAGYDGTGDLALVASRAIAYLDAGSAGSDNADVAAIVLFQGLVDSGVLNDAGQVTASDAITAHFQSIAGRYQGLSANTRQKLETASQNIASRANNAEALRPSTIVVAGRTLELTDPVFTYSGAIMMSLKDAAVFLGGKVVEMEDNATVVIQAPGVVLEMTKGSSDAYLGDKLSKMAQPVLSFDKVCYLPLNTVLQCCGMEQMTIGDYTLIYPAVPVMEQEK